MRLYERASRIIGGSARRPARLIDSGVGTRLGLFARVWRNAGQEHRPLHPTSSCLSRRLPRALTILEITRSRQWKTVDAFINAIFNLFECCSLTLDPRMNDPGVPVRTKETLVPTRLLKIPGQRRASLAPARPTSNHVQASLPSRAQWHQPRARC